jgi:hypothetical protein
MCLVNTSDDSLLYRLEYGLQSTFSLLLRLFHGVYGLAHLQID